MKKTIEDKFIILKLFQFIGGIICVIAGIILVVLDVNNPASFDLGITGFKVGISAISGVAVILAGVVLFFRSGGGIKTKKKVVKGKDTTTNEMEFSVDAYEDYNQFNKIQK